MRGSRLAACETRRWLKRKKPGINIRVDKPFVTRYLRRVNTKGCPRKPLPFFHPCASAVPTRSPSRRFQMQIHRDTTPTHPYAPNLSDSPSPANGWGEGGEGRGKKENMYRVSRVKLTAQSSLKFSIRRKREMFRMKLAVFRRRKDEILP